MTKLIALVLVLTFGLINVAEAKGRQPCSGKKGGVSHCSGKKFVCNDGSISASKKICS